jgi:hypothetical protein
VLGCTAVCLSAVCLSADPAALVSMACVVCPLGLHVYIAVMRPYALRLGHQLLLHLLACTDPLVCCYFC